MTSPSLQFMYALDEALAGLKKQNAPLHQVSTHTRQGLSTHQVTDDTRMDE